MTIRRANEQDIGQITAIYNHYVLHSTASFETVAVSRQEMARRMDEITRTCDYFVAQDDEGSILGYCYAHPWKERQAYARSYETTVYVHPDRLHEGIGRSLLEKLISACRQRDIHILIACITAENEASIRLHERFGFTRVSLFREVGYKFGRFLDVADLELILDKNN